MVGPSLPRRSDFWSVVPLALAAASWVAYFLVADYANRLRERFGPTPDVFEALGCDTYVSKRILPWLLGVILLDVMAVVSAFVPSRPGWPIAIKVLGVIVLVPTFCLHVFICAVTGLFAG